MGYEAALRKAWAEIGTDKRSVKFLNDDYEIDYAQRNIISMSCNASAKDYYKLLILHYLTNEHKVSGITPDKWISFREFEGGEIYFSAFKKRAIDPIVRKYGDNPSAIFDKIKTMNAEKIQMANAAILIKAFPKVNIVVELWAKDDEFSAECNMLFNPEIKQILPVEDVSVLSGIIASLL